MLLWSKEYVYFSCFRKFENDLPDQYLKLFQVWLLPFWLLETTWPKWLVNLADSFGFAIFASTLSTTRGTWRSILLENMLPSSACHALMKNVNQFSLINLILTTTFTKSIPNWWKGIGCFLAEPKYPAIIILLLSSNGSFYTWICKFSIKVRITTNTQIISLFNKYIIWS